MSEKKVMFTSGEMLASIFDVAQGSDLTHTQKHKKNKKKNIDTHDYPCLTEIYIKIHLHKLAK